LPNFTLPDAPGELVYKRYHTRPSGAGDLRKIVFLRSKLNPVERARLDAIATWPCRVVVEAGGVVCGVVMPHIPRTWSRPPPTQ
jgi:hypothetical protein